MTEEIDDLSLFTNLPPGVAVLPLAARGRVFLRYFKLPAVNCTYWADTPVCPKTHNPSRSGWDYVLNKLACSSHLSIDVLYVDVVPGFVIQLKLFAIYGYAVWVSEIV